MRLEDLLPTQPSRYAVEVGDPDAKEAGTGKGDAELLGNDTVMAPLHNNLLLIDRSKRAGTSLTRKQRNTAKGAAKELEDEGEKVGNR